MQAATLPGRPNYEIQSITCFIPFIKSESPDKPSFKINLDIRTLNGGNGIRGHKGLTRKALVMPLTAPKYINSTSSEEGLNWRL